MSSVLSSSRASAASEEVEVSGRGRGIRHIDLPAVFCTPAEQEMLSVVTAFDLSRNELEELTHLHPLRSLLRLNASYNHIHRFAGLPLALTQLSLAHNKLKGLDQLSQLPHLRELDVSFNRLSSLAGLTERVPLEVLNADDNLIQRSTGLTGVRTLKVLSLANNFIDDLDELLFLPSTPSLRVLRLNGNPLTRVRRYRATVAEWQPDLVSLDGVPLLPTAAPRPCASTGGSAQQAVSPNQCSQKKAHDASDIRYDGAASKQRSEPSYSQRNHPHSGMISKGFRHASSPTPASRRDISTSHRNSMAAAVDVAAMRNRVPPSSITATQTACLSAEDTRGGIVQQHQLITSGTQTSLTNSPTDSLNASLIEPREAPPQPSPPQLKTGDAASNVVIPSTTSKSRGPGGVMQRASAASLRKPAPLATPARASIATATEPVHNTVSKDETYAQAPLQEGEDSHLSVAVLALTSPASVQPTTGYAALHASPSTTNRQQCLSTATAAADSSSNNVSSSSALRCTSRFSRTPTLLQRSAASRELDSAAAQLHDSLVAKEQLDRECQALRRKLRQAESHLVEARRVQSQQLRELAQLRQEKQALKQRESDALEKLEKEKRSGRARAAHHTEEIETLQSQYARMKAFYETQLADTRRELSAEQGRAFHRRHGKEEEEGVLGEDRRSASLVPAEKRHARVGKRHSLKSLAPFLPLSDDTTQSPDCATDVGTSTLSFSPSSAQNRGEVHTSVDEVTAHSSMEVLQALLLASNESPSRGGTKEGTSTEEEAAAAARHVLDKFIAQHLDASAGGVGLGSSTGDAVEKRSASPPVTHDSPLIETASQQSPPSLPREEEAETNAVTSNTALDITTITTPDVDVSQHSSLHTVGRSTEEKRSAAPEEEAASEERLPPQLPMSLYLPTTEDLYSVPCDEEEEEEKSTTDTVVLAPPVEVQQHTAVPQQEDARTARVRAAKAVLKGMESLFEDTDT